MSENEMSFGEYIEFLRKSRRKSIRQTAIAIGVSHQFYSEVERNRRTSLSAERLEKLRDYLELTPEEYQIMSTKAAEAYKGKKQVPHDFADYIVERDYVMAALRTMKEMDADQADWARMVEAFIASKKEQNGD